MSHELLDPHLVDAEDDLDDALWMPTIRLNPGPLDPVPTGPGADAVPSQVVADKVADTVADAALKDPALKDPAPSQTPLAVDAPEELVLDTSSRTRPAPAGGARKAGRGSRATTVDPEVGRGYGYPSRNAFIAAGGVVLMIISMASVLIAAAFVLPDYLSKTGLLDGLGDTISQRQEPSQPEQPVSGAPAPQVTASDPDRYIDLEILAGDTEFPADPTCDQVLDTVVDSYDWINSPQTRYDYYLFLDTAKVTAVDAPEGSVICTGTVELFTPKKTKSVSGTNSDEASFAVTLYDRAEDGTWVAKVEAGL